MNNQLEAIRQEIRALTFALLSIDKETKNVDREALLSISSHAQIKADSYANQAEKEPVGKGDTPINCHD